MIRFAHEKTHVSHILDDMGVKHSSPTKLLFCCGDLRAAPYPYSSCSTYPIWTVRITCTYSGIIYIQQQADRVRYKNVYVCTNVLRW